MDMWVTTLLNTRTLKCGEPKQTENNSLLVLINIETASRSFFTVSFLPFNFPLRSFSSACSLVSWPLLSISLLFPFFIYSPGTREMQLQTRSLLSTVTWSLKAFYTFLFYDSSLPTLFEKNRCLAVLFVFFCQLIFNSASNTFAISVVFVVERSTDSCFCF